MIPSFVSDGLLTKLDNTDDSLKLGQFMIYTGLVSKAIPHTGMELEKYSKSWKKALFLAHSNNVFEIGAFYILEKKIDKKKTNAYLFLTCSVILALTFFDHWPVWL